MIAALARSGLVWRGFFLPSLNRWRRSSADALGRLQRALSRLMQTVPRNSHGFLIVGSFGSSRVRMVVPLRLAPIRASHPCADNPGEAAREAVLLPFILHGAFTSFHFAFCFHRRSR
jgi:hypothetical protein